MKITGKQIREMVQNQIRNTVSEMKYKKMYSLVKKCVDESFEDPRFNFMTVNDKPYDEETGEKGFHMGPGKNGILHMNKWGDTTPEFTDVEDDKRVDNEESWEELLAADKKKRKELGSNAGDIFNGKYDSEKDDYFEDSDFRHTQDYWKDRSPEASSDIQRARIKDVYDNTVESITEKIMKEIVNEGKIDDMVNTHYAVLKPIQKIVFSWDYNGYDPSELRLGRDTYFKQDIVDLGFDPKDIKIMTRKACVRMGIDPTDDSNWDNGTEYMKESKTPIKEENGGMAQPEKEDGEYEPTEAIGFYDFERICSENGWEWHNSMDVTNGNQTGVRYVFRKGRGCSFEKLVAKLQQAARNKDGIIPGTATNRQAPEINYYTIIVLD